MSAGAGPIFQSMRRPCKVAVALTRYVKSEQRLGGVCQENG
jgi:hypothetical protein